MGFGGHLGSGGEAGADGPDGLIGDDERGGCGWVDAFERDGELKLEDVVGEALFTLLAVLADADDGDDSVGERGLELEVDGGIGLVEVLAALGVADEYVGGSDGVEHQGRGLSGVGTVVVPVHGLGADVDLGAFGGCKCDSE